MHTVQLYCDIESKYFECLFPMKFLFFFAIMFLLEYADFKQTYTRKTYRNGATLSIEQVKCWK